MAELTQDEADELLAMEKQAADERAYHFPLQGEALEVPLIGVGREEFLLDIKHNRARLHKITYQNRARKCVGIARLDLNGPPHTNPEPLGGRKFDGPHLHVYREGYGLRYAVELDPAIFTDPTDPWQTFIEFQAYCNITVVPTVQRGVFI